MAGVKRAKNGYFYQKPALIELSNEATSTIFLVFFGPAVI